MTNAEHLDSERLRGRLNQAHGALLAVHKTLLDHERARYDRLHGRVASAGEVLQLLISDPFFQWLRPLTVLITQIDEITEDDEPLDVDAATALLNQSRLLLTPDENGGPYQREYARALQESPDIAESHGHWKLLLKTFREST